MTEPRYTEEELAAAEAEVPPDEPDNGVEDTEADEVGEEEATTEEPTEDLTPPQEGEGELDA